MLKAGVLRTALSFCLTFAFGLAPVARGQVSSKPTAACHVSDGHFTACPGGQSEWSDVQPLFFPASDTYLYVNDDASHDFIYLMYDFPFRTTPIGANEAVQVSFDTVEQDSGDASLEHYDISVFGDGHAVVLVNGSAEAPGSIVGAVGFSTSPNSAIPHLMAELQVPLTAGVPTTYSPDPIFWSVTTPPTPPPPPPPPTCLPFVTCDKTPEQIAAWNQAAAAANAEAEQILSEGLDECKQPLEAAEMALEQAGEAFQALVAAAKAAASRADLPAAEAGDLNNALIAADEAASELVQSAESAPPSALESAITVLVGIGATLVDAATAAAVASAVAEAAVVVAGAAAVAAASAVLATGLCDAAVEATAAVEFAKAKAYELLAADPPDPNFTVIAQPTIPSLSVQPLSTATGFSSQVVGDLNSLFSNLEQQIGLLQVIPTTVNRVSGAVAAGNNFWQQQQAQAAQDYASQLIPLLQNESSLRSSLASDFAASGFGFTFSASDVSSNLNSILENGLPSNVTDSLTQLGLDQTTQAAILQTAQSASPNLVASLGNGAFPQSLSDPSLAAANNAAIKGFTALADSLPSTSLSPSFSVTIPGDYTAAGVGLRGGTPPVFGPPPTSSTIGVSGIPTGASVVKAFLYWGMLDNGEDASLKNLSLNGTPVTGKKIGSGPDTCWGRTNSFTYRADVSPFVAGNGSYTLTNVASGGSILAEGASLVVVYQLAGLPVKTIMLDDGNVSIPQGTATATSSFSGFTAAGPVSATTTFMVGDGQATQFGQTPVTFTGSSGTLALQGLFAGNDGPLWDTDTFDVSSVFGSAVPSVSRPIFPSALGSADSSDSATIRVSSDCLLWSAQAFSVTSEPATPVPVTATAAVVKTNDNGDTVVNGLGLAPGDEPTLEDKIEMIVLNRAIENRTTSASDLAIQLVNSIPPAMLPPDQAAIVIQDVIKKLSLVDRTPPVISGMPATGSTLWPPNHKFVQVATVSASDALSGVASFSVTVASNEPSDPNSPDFIITGSGLGPRVIQLRADRLGTGTGRVYTLTATATDAAGNATTSLAEVTVPHDQGH